MWLTDIDFDVIVDGQMRSFLISTYCDCRIIDSQDDWGHDLYMDDCKFTNTVIQEFNKDGQIEFDERETDLIMELIKQSDAFQTQANYIVNGYNQ